MIRISVLILLIFGCVPHFSRAENFPDSTARALESQLENSESDSVRAVLFTSLFDHALDKDLGAAEGYLLKAEKENWYKQKGCFYQLHQSNWAVYHNRKGEPDKAKQMLKDILEAMKEKDCPDSYFPGPYHNLGNILLSLGDLEQAVYYLTLAHQHTTSSGNYKYRFASLNNLGIAYFKLKNYEKAEEYYSAALELARDHESPNTIASIQLNLGNIQFALKKYEDALTAFKEVVKSAEEIRDSSRLPSRYVNLGLAWYATGKLDSAEWALTRAAVCARAIDNPAGEALAIRNMANVEAARGNYGAATGYLEQSAVYFRENNQKDNLLNTYGLMADYYSRLGRFEKAFEHQKLYGKLLDSTSQQRMESKLASQLAEFEVSKLEAEKDSVQKALIISNQANEIKDLKLSRYVLLVVGLLVLILLGIVMVIAIFRARKLREELNIAEFRHTALRARMDPHFLFNALNSIQNAILNRDKMVAYEYHAKFSELMRMVLMHSDQKVINLEEELRSLRLYLDLELLRTNSGFEYQIQVAPEIKPETQDVPSMLLQPFVENAIWHGVMNRDTPGKIAISIEEKKSNILCSIDDNGVGRAAAQSSRKQGHTSVATKLTQDRIGILKQQFGEKADLQIIDKFENGESAGTLVEITFPKILQK